jgi:hypothetical protein
VQDLVIEIVKSGEKIHPLRDGTSGGQFISATLPDGTKFGAGAGQVAQPEPPANNN